MTANLANFAYDPINWDYLKKAQTLKLFVELLDSANEKLQLHGTSGLCNICLGNITLILNMNIFSFIFSKFQINKLLVTLLNLTILTKYVSYY